MASFRNNLAARLAADTYGLASSLLAATISARVLGPSGRGYYASLVLLSVLFAQLFNAGLGEAVIVSVGRGEAKLRTAVSATMAATLPLSLVGAVASVVTGAAVLKPESLNDNLALLVAGLVVFLNTLGNSVSWILVSQERIVLLAILNIASSSTITLAMYGLVAVMRLQASGAMLASCLGAVALLLPLLVALTRSGLTLRPKWNSGYLRAAVRFGAVVQLANLLVQMTGRLDLILVYRIASPAAAGRYSVALTLGALVASIPMAIAFASFPRLPKLTDVEAPVVIAGLFRVGVVASVVCALTLAASSPFLVPLVFGAEYRGAIAPSLLLLPGGVLWSGQWILCRAAAARGRPRPLFVSFLGSFLLMLVLDLVLIGPLGINGAATASLVSSAAGFVVAVVYHLTSGGNGRHLVPRPRDAARLVKTVREMVASARGRGAGKLGPEPRPAPSLPG